MALAEDAIDVARSTSTSPPTRRHAHHPHDPTRRSDRRPYQAGGRIVCHCERVTDGEIERCAATIPAVDIDGLRRRTRALAGRCQGFYCLAEVCRLTGWSVAP